MLNQIDRAKYAPEPQSQRKPNLIDRADEAVDIRDIYNPMAHEHLAPLGEYSSWKIFCPFAWEHADGGLDKNCRIYPPTHIYCWAMHGVIAPTALYARWKGMPRMAAAEELLKERGLLQAKNFREQWNELMDLREEKLHQRLGHQSYAIDALQQALSNDASYVEAEYTDAVREAWVRVLAVLDLLWQKPETDAIILQQWFDKSLRRIKDATA